MYSRKKGKWDDVQLLTYTQNDNKILKALRNDSNGLSRSEIKVKTGLSYSAIRKHLTNLISKGELKEYDGKIFWLHWYLELMGNTSAAYSQELQKILASMLNPESIYSIHREGIVPLPKRFPVNADPDAPATTSFMTDDEWRDFFIQKEKVFGALRHCFFDLARFLMKVDIGFINAKDDLSNVTINFANGRAVWRVDASV